MMLLCIRQPRAAINLVFLEKLRALAAGESLTPLAMAIAWVLARREVTSALVGAPCPDQVEKCILAARQALPSQLIAQIDALLAERESALTALEALTIA